MKILEVKNLCKIYPGFELSDVSFSAESGRIMGFIGRNGSGKTTTIKSILNMVHPESGTAVFSGLEITENEAVIKKRIGYAVGAIDYYKRKKIRKIVSVTKKFYEGWDDSVYRRYMNLFSIDENKTPSELSEGMKVKLNLAIALSHGADFLVLDEPTSGLDPVSREELLEIFRYLKTQGISILFSTHITSDLDKCADDITYIRSGKIIYSGSINGFSSGGNLEETMLEYEREAFLEKSYL